jgi:methylase of polypeptide subunit release factors
VSLAIGWPVKPPRIGVIGCGAGAFVIAIARASPAAVLAGFDSDPQAVASARHAAARAGLADRVTFEVAAPGNLLGASYDVIYLLPPRASSSTVQAGWATGHERGYERP